MRYSKRSTRHKILIEILAHLKTAYDFDPPPDSLRSLLNSAAGIEPLLSFRSDAHLDDLRGALLRLESGTYGICIACKQQIPQASLDADVTRRVCPSCEADFNHRYLPAGGTAHTHR
ncbi:MAG TPA: hypothetical protein VMF59_16175 [Bacteroidota bacterium]|nr:hypothetical protein [Bacteroidota bacterium]